MGGIRLSLRRVLALVLCLLAPGIAQAADDLSAAVTQFYEMRQGRLAWNAPGMIDQLVANLQRLSTDGLNPEDYGVALLQSGAGEDAQRDRIATRSCLLALLHLYRGTLDPATLHSRGNLKPREIDRAAGLKSVSDALDRGEVDALFESARPGHLIYARLRAALGELRDVESRGGWPGIPAGPTLELGTSGARVALLRRRLALGGYLPATATGTDAYDEAVEAAVRQFQDEQYLEPDGKVGRASLRALNVTVAARIAQLRVNLERARWVLPRIAGDFVMVDVAGYKVRYFKDGQVVWTSKVQVGRTMRRTPIFKAQITNIILSPTWTVPPRILREDVLPKVREDVGYLAQNRIRVLDGRGREVDPRRVDWDAPNGLLLRQDAGPDNSLGRIKIVFPNPYDVYLHETPHKELFGKSQRAFSSGCIRVERPFELAELLFDGTQSKEALESAADEVQTREVRLPHPVPILVMYWTVDLHGARIAFKPDLYRLDAPTLAALTTPLPPPPSPPAPLSQQ